MIEKLVRSHFHDFQPYRSARSEVRSAEIFLDANELAAGSPVAFRNLQLHRYPDPVQTGVRTAFGERLSMPAARIFAGAGSDEIIDLLIRLICEPGRDRILVNEPTYGVYQVAAEVNAVGTVVCGLDGDFQLDLPRIRAAAGEGVKIMFICSPNNPTGNLLRREDILALCDTWRGLVVVDEAYVDFGDPGSSLVPETLTRRNLAVLRTMSKSYGLAGIRLGYCIADPVLVEYLQKIKAPYNISSVTAALAIEALADAGFPAAAAESIRRERIGLTARLAALPAVVRIFPSDANFLLVEMKDAGKAYRFLADHGVIVRRRGEPRLRSSLRITVGTAGENQRIVELIGQLS